MTRTFLVSVEMNQTDEISLAGMAEEIQDSCMTDGIAVLSVKPWNAPSAGVGQVVEEDSAVSAPMIQSLF